MSLVIMIRASQKTTTRHNVEELPGWDQGPAKRERRWRIIDINWSCCSSRECLRKSNFHSDFNGSALSSIGICFDFGKESKTNAGWLRVTICSLSIPVWLLKIMFRKQFRES